MSTRKAVIFCSSQDLDQRYIQAARKIVRAACLAGYDIVSGGTVKGLMNHVCDEAARCGAGVIGVIPRFMKGLEHPSLTSCIWTDTMSQRKELMREGTSLAIALPGGIGTLDELAETYCLAKMGIYKGKVAAFNMEGFYEPLKSQLDLFVRSGMLPESALELLAFPETFEDVEALL